MRQKIACLHGAFGAFGNGSADNKSQRLFAARLDGGDCGEIGREIVRGKVLNIHFDQADERTTEIWFHLSASIDNHADCGNDTAVGANDIDCFLNATSAGDNVFDDDEVFIRRDLKAAAQDKFAILFFDKDVAFAQLAADFLADNNSAEGRGDDRVAIKFAQFIGEPSTNSCSNVGMLKEYRALEILPAVQAGPQDEVSIEQRARFAEQR